MKFPFSKECTQQLQRSQSDKTTRWLDRYVLGGLILLIGVTPLAIGSVNRNARIAMEMAAFALVVLWMTRWLASAAPPAPAMLLARRLSPCFAAMLGLLTFQLLPLPPVLLRALSPKTYQLYQIALPGWRSEEMHSEVLVDRQVAPDSESGERPVLASEPKGHVEREPSHIGELKNGGRQRLPLTVSPSVTAASLIEFAALGSIFFVVLLYPFGVTGEPRTQVRLIRSLVYCIVAAGIFVAFIGIAQRAWWNGKILWIYSPTDWPGPGLTPLPRASGPFVNPDHFATYLAMVLPLAVTGGVFGFSLVPQHRLCSARLLCLGGAVLMLSAVVLSLSRGGGIAAAVGIVTALVFAFRAAPDRAPVITRRIGGGAVTLSLGTFALMIGIVIYLIGTPAQLQLGKRMADSGADDISTRVTAWRETLEMAADFRLFGVGGGAWPEVFPHYQAPPKSPYYFWRAAEDDYLQFAAETGIAGILIVVVFAALLTRSVIYSAQRMPARRAPLLAGLAGGLLAGLAQEFVDFGLQVPANALMFTILLALMSRVATIDSETVEPRCLKMAQNPPAPSALPLLLAAAAIFLMIAALEQDGQAYPYALDHPKDLVVAEENLWSHPAMAATHLAMTHMLPMGDLQNSHLSAALWLEPNDTAARDLYARNLLVAGHKAEGLKQISLSVYHGPFIDLHYYLAPGVVSWLLPEEQQAIARGFDRAIDSEFIGAAGQAALFYEQLGRYHEAGDANMRAARLTADNQNRFNFLRLAARDYLQTHQYTAAEQVLLLASQIRPDDPDPYVETAQDIYAAEHNLAAARAIIERGIQHGADPYLLQMALATAAEQTGDYSLTEAALTSALRYDPSFEATLKLGRIYFVDQQFDHSIATLRQAAKLSPHSAEPLMWLARAQEANYEYYAADRSWREAIHLAPGDKDLRAEYQGFQQRTASKEKRAEDE